MSVSDVSRSNLSQPAESRLYCGRIRRKGAMTKRKFAAIAVLGLVIASVLVLLLVPQDGLGFQGTGTIGVLRLSGPIQDAGGSLLGAASITPALVSDRLRHSDEDPSVAGLVVRINSPGGSVAASQEIAALFEEFSKPLVVSMGDMAASGGYYVAARADRIVAQPGTLTGSIGVIWTQIDPTELLNELGVEIEAITAGKHKDMFLPGRLTEPRRRIIQDIVDEDRDRFIEAVAEGRDLSQDVVEGLATGEPFTGAQALTAGLVDELGGENKAVDIAADLAGVNTPRVKVLTPSFFERLAGGPGLSWFGGSNLDPAMPRLDTRILLLRDVLIGLSGPRYQLP